MIEEEYTRKALIERPLFSIRMQIYISMVLSIIVILSIAIIHFITLRTLDISLIDGSVILLWRIHSLLLIILFLIILFNTYLFSRRVLAPINRFVLYTQRIAVGDYSMIKPARPYRDEFCELAIAINMMIKELEFRQEILIQSHKLQAIGSLIAGVAHELNNPINNIMLTSSMLKEDYGTLSDAENLDMIEDIIDETDRSKRIITNLLDFARDRETKIEPLLMGNVVKETLKLAANQISLKGVKINLSVIHGLPVVQSDRHQMIQVFLNVLINALDATPKGGSIRIEVGTSNTSKFLTVKFTDSGTGIPENVIPSIFDPFFTTKSKEGGTGLGLSVCQGILSKLNGDISAYSNENVGTTFTVALPLTQDEKVEI
jgi:two-component system, NtrC family, sensor kinase